MEKDTGVKPGLLTRTAAQSWIVMAVAALLGMATLGVAASPQTPAASTSIFEKLVLERIQAYGRGDFRAYTALLDKDFVHISDVGERRTAAEMASYIVAGASPGTTFAVRELAWHVYGDLAVVDCEVDLLESGGKSRLHETNIFNARGGRWVYLLHQETIVQESPSGVVTEPKALLDFVGEYRSETGGRDIISTREGKLFGQGAPGDAPTPFVQIAQDAFVVSRDPAVTIFERDPHGKVFGYVLRNGNGRLVKAKKIE